MCRRVWHVKAYSICLWEGGEDGCGAKLGYKDTSVSMGEMMELRM